MHSVVITAYTQGVGGGPSPNETFIIALGTPPPTNSCCRLLLGGVLRQQNDNNGVVTAAYNAAAYGVFSDMASDGLNVSFVPVRNYVNDTTDMANQLHPNDTGQTHLVRAFEASWSNGTYINGLPLYLWAVASGSGGTSGKSSYQQFTTCPLPAGVGGTVAPGGYTGSPQNISAVSAWNAATHVSDGGVTWVCLTPVDYNNFTAANADDPTPWSAGLSLGTTQFVVTAAGNAYGSWSDACTTGTTAPTSTTYGTLFGDGTCSLVYQGNIGYSSKANILPHQLTPYHIGGVPAGVSQYSWHSYLKLWWGGAARPEYVDGANGELTQITLGWHFSSPSDGGVVNKPPGSYGLVSATSGYDLAQEIMAAPGDGFGDNMNPAPDPLRYDPTKGVAVFSSQTWRIMVKATRLQWGMPYPGETSSSIILNSN